MGLDGLGYGSAVGGYGSVVLVVEAFVVGSNVGVDDGNDEVRAKVGFARGFEAEELRPELPVVLRPIN